MANISVAKVTIIAEKVGPELEAYIESAGGSDYTILDADSYTVEKQGDTWVFRGAARGRWNYGNNLADYFSQAGDEALPLLADEWNDTEASAFVEALRARGGTVRFVVADSEEGAGWVETSTAICRVDNSGRLCCETKGAGRVPYTTANVMAAYDCTLREAAYLRLEEDAEEFFEEWDAEHPGQEPRPEDFDEWAEAW
ncbi:MAG: hypothetical protein LBJ02_07875 [Bifidobacteriaceae bacterium]|jgi:hypothetical protein|nr:hypothetical protein [Bifidobacteriaceae bacterium]